MEFKKKTIIWEDNNEPPKDYIWIKSDGKAYEFDYKDRKWVESKSISGESGDSGSGSGEGSGLSDNLIDNWVNLVTQGEYTKYKDVPEGHTVKVGVMEGWSRPPEDNGLIVEETPSTISANLSNIVDGQEQVVLFKNVSWKVNSSHIII